MHDELFMKLCLTEAQEAYDAEEVPVGALVVAPDGEPIARAHNLTVRTNSPTAHAEILAITEAARVLENFRLIGCTLYVTKEPCIMCAGAIIEARIKRLVFGCFDQKRGAFGSLLDVNKIALNHKVDVDGGVLRERSEDLLQRFFRQRRGTEVVITGPTRNRLFA
jgi:tRNA(adenine34) deaminase